MYTVKHYCMASSLDEAYKTLQENRNNILIGGNLWLRMGERRVNTAIDLSGLGLDTIEETDEGFRIGCMVSLRQLETHEGLHEAFGGLFKKALCPIVGVQFRNCARVGGSLFPRFGFSDVLTAFLACDTEVELYKAGRKKICEFAAMPVDRDILTHVLVRKDHRKVDYRSFRMTETDFPTVTCAVICKEGRYSAVIGARPGCARLVEDVPLDDPQDAGQRAGFARKVAAGLDFGSNMRGSADYRRDLSCRLIMRCLEQLEGEVPGR